jgi:hypothetical protein
MKDLLLDSTEAPKNKNCHVCGTPLNDSNTSLWSVLIPEHPGSARVCVKCKEISDRMLAGASIIDHKIISLRTKESVIKEIEDEGLTDTILKAMEEKLFKRSQ